MESKIQHVCPWWMGYFLLIPFRKYYHNPAKMLMPWVKPGMKVVDYGCAMGYFSLPLANLVGKTGRVYAVDIQQKMIDRLIKRARKEQLDQIIQPVLVTETSVLEALSGQINFALLFAMVHEVPDQGALFTTIGKLLQSGSFALFAEPRGHVSEAAFNHSLQLASEAGLEVSQNLRVNGSHAVVLVKK
jgi:ubiquinone/menaquinone biosynthesis C-methylase UbiE